MENDDHDDDPDEPVGPPPDPSLREWRHPSEIAAAAAAGDRPLRPTHAGRRAALKPLVGGLVLVVAVITAGMLAVGVSFMIGADEGSPGSVAAGRVDNPLASQAVDRSTEPEPDADVAADSTDPETSPPKVASTSTTAGRQPTTTSQVVNAAPPSTPGALLDPALRPDIDPAIGTNAVFGMINGRLERLGSYTVAEGMVFTSSSALGDHDPVVVVAHGSWAEAQVLGADPTNDVAVLEIGLGRIEFLRALADHDAAELAPPPAADDNQSVMIDGPDPQVTGTIVGRHERTMTTSGFAVYHALLVDTTQPAGMPGSALLDHDGAMIGFIVDGSGQLTAAIPIGRVVSIGRALTDWGLPAVEWLGIQGQTNAGGGVLVEGIAVESPASSADLRSGDVIVALNGTQVIDWDHLVFLIRHTGSGNPLSITVKRDGQKLALEATVGSNLDDPSKHPPTD